MAGELVEADRGPHGIPMSEATNPENRDVYVAPDTPHTDFAAKAMRDSKKKYYARYPSADEDRDVHVWRGVSRR